MSSVSGGGARSRGRGHAAPKNNATPRTLSTIPRGPANTTNNKRGSRMTRGMQNTAGRGNSRASTSTLRANSPKVRNTSSVKGSKTHGDWQERQQTLKQLREKERTDAIRRGLMADPEKPRALVDAITPVGTCQDMCPEYERVLRVVQKDVWDEETDPNHSAFARGEPEPDESRMVKKFRRSAAGNDEQLPSDLRPPLVLKRTCDYLFHDVIGHAPSLAKVHHFVWDRTRAVRNDFSIQQLTKPEDLRVAIECYERIARFHIASLHLLALPEKPYDKYDAQQEREQLDRTLVSLMQYYDDCRDRFELANEAEFRAYTIIFKLRDSNPDLEDRVQNWPQVITRNARVQKALDIYAAACDTFHAQGPLKPGTSHVIARQDWERFWQIVSSRGVSYLMACVAEIYFTPMRRMVLRALFRTTSKKSAAAKSTSSLEWSVDELWDLFNFDDESELIKFCEHFGFSFRERDEDGQMCLDLSSVHGRNFPEPTAGIPFQSKSSLVEGKRHRRSIPAIIDGLNVRQAELAGLTVEEEDDRMSDIAHIPEQNATRVVEPQEEEDSLFIPEITKSVGASAPGPVKHTTTLASGPASVKSSSSSTFGKSSVFGQPSQSTGFNFGQQSTQPSENADNKPVFSFLSSQKVGSDSDQAPSAKTPSMFTNTVNKPPNQQSSEKKTGFSFTNGANGSSLPGFFNSGAAAVTGTSQPLSGIPRQLNESSITGPTLQQVDGKSKEEIDASTANPIGPALFTSAAGLTGTFPTLTSQTQSPSFPRASTPPQEKTTVVTPPAKLEVSPNRATHNTLDHRFNNPLTFPHSSASTANSSGSSSQHEITAKSPQPPPQSQLSPSNAQGTGAPSSSAAHSNTQSLRRQSMNDWKPKTPSKLSNSFTVNNDGSSPQQTEMNETLHVNKADVESFPNNQIHPFETTSTQSKASSSSLATPQTISLDSIITRLAQELTFDPIAGFMRQYVDFFVSHVISNVQENIYYERVHKEADEFREFCLAHRYGTKWRDICRHNRLLRQGRERRQRAQRRLHQTNPTNASGDASHPDNASIKIDDGTATSTARSESRHKEVNAMFQSTLGTIQNLRDAQSRVGNKRSAISNARDVRVHKRLKSDDYPDDSASAISTQPSLPDSYDMSQRSSFLGFSLPSNAPNRASTTRSPYFRMKALGIELGLDRVKPRTLKRPRSESLGASIVSKMSRCNMPSMRSSPEYSRPSDVRPASSSSSTAANAEDEALFARLKAAREGLKNGADFLKSETEKDSTFRASVGSASSSDSPSMALARVEARRRAAQVEGVKMDGIDVPTYRLRESRFVPREDYARAISRSNELRAPRSHEHSRPGSGQGQHSTDHFATLSTLANNREVLDNPDAVFLSNADDNGLLSNSTVSSKEVPETSQSSLGPGVSNSSGFRAHVPHVSASKSMFMNNTAQPYFDTNTGATGSPSSGQLGRSSLVDYDLNAVGAPYFTTNSGSQPPRLDPTTEALQGNHINHTVAPAHIPSALSNSFGAAGMTHHSPTFSLPNSSTVPRPTKHAISENDSIMSTRRQSATTTHLGLEKQPQSSNRQGTNNGLRHTIDPNPNPPNPYVGFNRFAALADEDAGDEKVVEYQTEDGTWNEEDGSEMQESELDGSDHVGITEQSEWARAHNGYILNEEEMNDMDGYIEDYTEEDMEEDEEEPDSDLEDDEDPGVNVGRYYIQPPPKLPTVEDGPGNNADEPIELSD